MRIIPAIDIIEGKCVRLSQGDYSKKKIYNERPLEVAIQFEDAGLRYIHIVDLDGAKAGNVQNWKAVEAICEKTALQIDFGGGVKKEEEVKRLLNMGVTQINVGSMAIKQPEIVGNWISKFGSAAIILSADVKNNFIAIQGWQTESTVTINKLIEGFQRYNLKFVTCTDIAKDGMLSGPNFNLYQELKLAFPNINIIASGGITSLEDLQTLKSMNTYGAIIGKAIYEGTISLEQLATLQ